MLAPPPLHLVLGLRVDVERSDAIDDALVVDASDRLRISDVSSPLFGLIDGTVSTPTSIFGTYLGSDASPRMIQLKGTLEF